MGEGGKRPAISERVAGAGARCSTKAVRVTGTRTFTWFLSVVVIAALALALSAIGVARPVQSWVQWLAEPVESTVQGAVAPVADFVANVGSYGRIREENRDLLEENERLRANLALAREDQIRANDVTDLLGVGGRPATEQIAYARIVARDPRAVRDLVAVSLGRGNGIVAGMPVLGRGGALVGTVETVLESVSWVRLISDGRSEVNVILQESRTLALASGAPDRRLTLEYLAQGSAVNTGDTVVTSGLGGSYPPGLILGRVMKVEGGAADVFKRVEVEPLVRLSSLETVAILTGFVPAPVEGLGR